MLRIIILSSIVVGLATGCGDHGHSHDTGDSHAHEGAHGGDVLELSGHAGHLELVQDQGAGKMTIYVLGEDAKTPMPVARAPELKMVGDAGATIIETTPVGSDGATFEATSEALKSKFDGRITIEVKGKTYNPEAK